MTAPNRFPRPVDAAALTRLVFGDFALDLASGELRWGGEPVDLEPQPTKVLRHLALHSGDLVLREDLHRLLWGDDTHVEADQGLNYCIKELRRALGDSARNPRYIETLTRRGYRFLPPVELAGPAEAGGAGAFGGAADPARATGWATAAPALAAVPSDARSRSGRERSRGWKTVALTALVVAAVLGAGWLSGRLRPEPRADQPEEAALDAGPPRIAVLPFDAAEPSDENEAVARRLASQLVSDLVRATGPRFEVIASTTSFAYQDAGKTIGQIGRELRVAYVVEGIFHRSGSESGPQDGRAARLCVRLVDTREEVVVWTGSYTVDVERLDELPRSVSDEMSATLLPPG